MRNHLFWGLVFGILLLLQFIVCIRSNFESTQVIKLFLVSLLTNLELGIDSILEAVEKK